MFEGLQDRLQGVFRRLRGEGRVSREVLEAALKEIRMALLEADVNFRVVKAFVARIREKAGGDFGNSRGGRLQYLHNVHYVKSL